MAIITSSAFLTKCARKSSGVSQSRIAAVTQATRSRPGFSTTHRCAWSAAPV